LKFKSGRWAKAARDLEWNSTEANEAERKREINWMFILFNTCGLHVRWPSADVMPIRRGGMVYNHTNDVPGYFAIGMLNPNSKTLEVSLLSDVNEAQHVSWSITVDRW
jgi:hypothetical protein